MLIKTHKISSSNNFSWEELDFPLTSFSLLGPCVHTGSSAALPKRRWHLPLSFAWDPSQSPPEAGWSPRPLRGSKEEQRGTVGWWVCWCPVPRVRRWPMRWRSCHCSPHRICLRSMSAKTVRMWCCTGLSWHVRMGDNIKQATMIMTKEIHKFSLLGC